MGEHMNYAKEELESNVNGHMDEYMVGALIDEPMNGQVGG